MTAGLRAVLASKGGRQKACLSSGSFVLEQANRHVATAIVDQNTPDLSVGLETSLPPSVHVGRGVAIPIAGWCYSNAGTLFDLAIVAGDRKFDVSTHSWARPDVLRNQCPRLDYTGNSLMSGFHSLLPIRPVAEPVNLPVSLRAKIKSGVVVERALGTMRLLPGTGAEPTQVEWPTCGPRIVICMTTFDPPVDLFEGQIRSLQAQTHRNWICIVCDDGSPAPVFEELYKRLSADKRFYIYQNTNRLGFYYNFENSMKRVPSDADFVGLCDQDDLWHPTKLEVLLANFDQSTQLVYSDARIVRRDGQVISNTFWRTRGNNYTNLSSLIVANTITGAASMFRVSLVADLLPFPKPIADGFHDHWIALTALTKGKVKYVDKALYDYIQHSTNVIGHTYGTVPGLMWIARRFVRAIRRHDSRDFIASAVETAAANYPLVRQKVLLARNLLIRFPDAPPRRRATLGRFARLERSVLVALYEKLLATVYQRPTLNLEALLLYAVIAVKLRNAASRISKKRLVLQRRAPVFHL